MTDISSPMSARDKASIHKVVDDAVARLEQALSRVCPQSYELGIALANLKQVCLFAHISIDSVMAPASAPVSSDAARLAAFAEDVRADMAIGQIILDWSRRARDISSAAMAWKGLSDEERVRISTWVSSEIECFIEDEASAGRMKLEATEIANDVAVMIRSLTGTELPGSLAMELCALATGGPSFTTQESKRSKSSTKKKTAKKKGRRS